MFVVDAHEDIAWNALTFGRDYTRSALWLRQKEAEGPVPSRNGSTLLGKSDWLLGHMAVIFATLYVSPARHKKGEWDIQSYTNAREAYTLAAAQLDFYHRLADEQHQFKLVCNANDLEQVVSTWDDGKPFSEHRIGLLPLMEGADPVLEPEQVEEWFERGVRIIGPAWESTRYAGGTHEPGPLTPDGRRLLDVMASLGIILDLSHLAEEAYYQALECYPNTPIVSHANPRRFLPTSRGLSDEMIELVAERGGVVGIVPYNAFLKPGWRKGDARGSVTLLTIVDAIDHICQITGSADHVGIGSDFDGGFGVEHVPAGIDTVADLMKLEVPLRQRGYTAQQILNILGVNWLRVLRQSLPA